MTTIARLALATTAALGMLTVASPSFATNTSDALKLCRLNSHCHSRVGEHSIIMTIDGQDAVECPKLSTGECIVVRIGPAHRNINTQALGQSFAAN